jgi:hypothetical protein
MLQSFDVDPLFFIAGDQCFNEESNCFNAGVIACLSVLIAAM